MLRSVSRRDTEKVARGKHVSALPLVKCHHHPSAPRKGRTEINISAGDYFNFFSGAPFRARIVFRSSCQRRRLRLATGYLLPAPSEQKNSSA